jgi:hypothetical protein
MIFIGLLVDRNTNQPGPEMNPCEFLGSCSRFQGTGFREINSIVLKYSNLEPLYPVTCNL